MKPQLVFHHFDPAEQYAGYWAAKAVEEGMAPFRLKRIDVYCQFDIDSNEVVLFAGAVLSNGFTIGWTTRINRWDLEMHPEEESQGGGTSTRLFP